MTETADIATLIEAARAGAQAFLDALDQKDRGQAVNPQTTGTGPTTSPRRIAYDPLIDRVPLPQNPSPAAPEPAQRMATLTYLGAIARINATEGRGANREEVTKYARKAGYSRGNSVNGWNSNARSQGSIENIDGARYLNEAGHKWVRTCADILGIEIIGDITPLDIPEH